MAPIRETGIGRKKERRGVAKKKAARHVDERRNF
jgi:hypothetical protein